MKKLIVLAFLIMGVVVAALGQERVKKTIELKIGLSVTGYIIELEDGNYMLETDAGDIVFYTRDEIRSIKNPEEVKAGTETSHNNPPANISIPKRNSLQMLLDYYGIEKKLEEYRELLSVKKRKQAKAIEDELWEIEQKVKEDTLISESARDEFVEYIEKAEDKIEKEAKRERKKVQISIGKLNGK